MSNLIDIVQRLKLVNDYDQCKHAMNDAITEIQQLRNRVVELEEANKLLEADAKRYEWVLDNCTTVGGGHGVQVSFFVPVDHEDLSCAIDMAMEKQNDNN